MAYTAGITYDSYNTTKEGIDYFLLASFDKVKATITNGVATITLPNGDPITSSPFVKILVPYESSFYTDEPHCSNRNGSFFYEHLVSIRLSKIQHAATELVKRMVGKKTMIIAVGYDGVGYVLGHSHGCKIITTKTHPSHHYTEFNFRAVEIECKAEVNDSNLSLLNP